MKLDSSHTYYNGCCCGCNAAMKGEDVDPDALYSTWLCGRCRAELEQLPERHKIVFDRLKREMNLVEGKAKLRAETISVLEGFIRAHGLNPQDANDSYANNAANQARSEAK